MTQTKETTRPTPFLKWAGGKRWLTENYPEFFDIEFDRFIEPFLGGGAVFFELVPERAILADTNEQLIETYKAIRDNWERVVFHIKRHDTLHSKSHYYSVRHSSPRSEATRAARFIYLNRACWNGLYRVNLNGQFNVPIGSRKNILHSSDDFESVASTLTNAILKTCDFEKTIARAREGDFVFVDPPYTVRHNNNGFIKYNESLFSWKDQIRLRDSVIKAVGRGAIVLVCNANHSSVRYLYSGIGKIRKLKRPSLIAADKEHRGKFEELVIQCPKTS